MWSLKHLPTKNQVLRPPLEVEQAGKAPMAACSSGTGLVEPGRRHEISEGRFPKFVRTFSLASALRMLSVVLVIGRGGLLLMPEQQFHDLSRPPDETKELYDPRAAVDPRASRVTSSFVSAPPWANEYAPGPTTNLARQPVGDSLANTLKFALATHADVRRPHLLAVLLAEAAHEIGGPKLREALGRRASVRLVRPPNPQDRFALPVP